MTRHHHAQEKKKLAKIYQTNTYESIALGSASDLISDNHSLQNLTVLLKVFSHGLLRSFPR